MLDQYAVLGNTSFRVFETGRDGPFQRPDVFDSEFVVLRHERTENS